MTEDQPTSDEISAQARVSCTTCHFSREFRNPQNPLQKFFICKFMPPSPAFMPTNQGPAMFGSKQAQVIKDEWCFQWTPRRAHVVYDDEKAPLVGDLLSEVGGTKIHNS